MKKILLVALLSLTGGAQAADTEWKCYAYGYAAKSSKAYVSEITYFRTDQGPGRYDVIVKNEWTDFFRSEVRNWSDYRRGSRVFCDQVDFGRKTAKADAIRAQRKKKQYYREEGRLIILEDFDIKNYP